MPGAGTPTSELPRKGAKLSTIRCTKFLGVPIDIAYEVRDGMSPVWLLPAIPLAVVGVLVPMPAGAVLMGLAGVMLFAFGFLSKGAYVALAGDRLWLIRARSRAKVPTKVLYEGTRADVVHHGGKPFPLVEIAGRRIYFIYPVTKVAAMLPASSHPAPGPA